jgi:hypothetical protein
MPSATKQNAQQVIDRLLTLEAELVVTVTCPLDRRRPGNEEERIRLRNLLADARSQVLARWEERRARPLLDHLDRAASTVDLRGRGHGLVVVATTDHGEAHLLPFPVQEGVALDATPATRFLLQGLRRSPRYRVLVLSDDATRLFEAIRDELVEVHGHGFPFAADITPRDRRAVAGRFALSPGRDDKELWRKFYREVDHGLTEASRSRRLPLVLVGVRASTALFDEVTRHDAAVIGRIDGSYDHATPHDLGELTWPILRDHLRDRRVEVVGELRQALAGGRAVTGIDEVWQLGREGRGRLLVVEEDYRAEPSVEVDGRLIPAPDPGASGVMHDPVDELIEHVVRAGGAVEFVGPDGLAGLAHVGLLLR